MRWITALIALCLLASISTQAQRPVVIEEFTGTWCGYCYAAGIALDRIEQAHSRDEVIILAYHRYDAYEISPFCASRVSLYSVGGYPTAWFNGYTDQVGGFSVDDGEAGIDIMHDIYMGFIESEQTRTAGTVPFDLTLHGEVGPTDPHMELTVSTATGYPRTVNVIFVITEDGIPVSASNGQTELNSVVRAHLGTQAITLTSPGSTDLTAALSGTIPHISADELHPAVLLQDATTREIVGAKGTFDPTAVDVPWTLYR